MKKKDIFTQAAEEKRQDFYYKPGEDGHGLYAVPINTEGLFNLSEEQLQELKIMHETIQKKLDIKSLSDMSYSESLEVLNNSKDLQLIEEGLNRHYFKKKAFLGVSDVLEN
jgi:hypothetical protein